MRKQFQDHLPRNEWLRSPIDGNEGKQTVLDLVPFAGSRRIKSDGDGELLFIGEFLQFLFPEAISNPVGATTICGNEQSFFVGIERLSPLLPPPSDALDGKFCRVVINADIDKTLIMDQIVDSIRNSFAISKGKKIVDIHFRFFPFGLPFGSIVLEIANQLLFLTVDRNDGVALLLKRFALRLDLLKLGVSVGMRSSFDVFLIGA